MFIGYFVSRWWAEPEIFIGRNWWVFPYIMIERAVSWVEAKTSFIQSVFHSSMCFCFLMKIHLALSKGQFKKGHVHEIKPISWWEMCEKYFLSNQQSLFLCQNWLSLQYKICWELSGKVREGKGMLRMKQLSSSKVTPAFQTQQAKSTSTHQELDIRDLIQGSELWLSF